MFHLDIFSGIGGFAIAAHWAGFTTIGFAEIEPYCCDILKQYWPTVPNHGDIRTADFTGLRSRVALLTGGVPCQPASVAGQRRGAADDRWLWPAALHATEQVRPLWAVFENPPNIRNVDGFEAILLQLDALGYEHHGIRVPANAVGADHLRNRLFIIARDRGKDPLVDAHERRFVEQTKGRQGTLGTGTPDEFVGPSQDADPLADTHEQSAPWENQSRRESKSGDVRDSLADTARSGRVGWRTDSGNVGESQEREWWGLFEFARCGQTVAESDRPRLEKHKPGKTSDKLAPIIRGGGPDRSGGISQSNVCGTPDGISQKLDAIVANWNSGNFPPPLTQERIPNRASRLRALGNAVCPVQCYPILQSIAETILSRC